MSTFKTTAHVHVGDWDAETDKDPAMKFMHAYTNAYDAREVQNDWDKWTTPDFEYSKSSGQVFGKGQESRDAVVGDYAAFTQFYHEPYFFVYWGQEDGSGWEMTGNAWLYANLPGDGQETVKDARGRGWQIRVPGGFHFVYKKQSDGSIKMATTAITSDSGPAVVELLKRGVLKPADLGL